MYSSRIRNIIGHDRNIFWRKENKNICLEYVWKRNKKPEASFIILSIRNSVSDSHQDNADLDPRIRTGPFRSGSGSGSYSLKIPSVFFIPLFGSLVNISPFYFIEMNNLFYPFEIIDKIDLLDNDLGLELLLLLVDFRFSSTTMRIRIRNTA